MRKDLPVDPERLKREFPELSEEDLQAYVTITQRVLGKPAERAKKMREVMASARHAQEKAESGAKLTKEEDLLVGYLRAMSRMQRSTVRH